MTSCRYRQVIDTRSGRAAEDFVSIGCKIMTEISDNVTELVTKVGRVLQIIDLIAFSRCIYKSCLRRKEVRSSVRAGPSVPKTS
jgi:hypothetical protein